MNLIMEPGVRIAGFPRNRVESLCVIGHDKGRFFFYWPEDDQLLDSTHVLVQPAAQRELDNAK